MTKIYPYSLDRKDAKIAGVCSTLGNRIGVDPTFVRIGFVAAAILISFKLTLVAYAALGIWLAVQKKKSIIGDRHMSDFGRMDEAEAILDELLRRAAATLAWPAVAPSQPRLPGLD